MRAHFLGTGSADGWPNPFCDCSSCHSVRATGKSRAPSSILIDDCLLVDCGPTAPHAAARAGRSLSDVEHVLITHGHPDHLHPAFLLAWQWVRCPHRLHIWGPQGAIDLCRDWIGPDAAIDLHVLVPGQTVDLVTQRGTYIVAAVPAAHAHGDGDSLAEEALLYDILSPDAIRLLYATDTGPLPTSTIASLGGRFDCVIVDETFGTTTDHGRGHLDLSTLPLVLEALRVAGCVDTSTNVIATHLSHHNPPPEELVPTLAQWGVQVFDDLDHVDLASGRRVVDKRRILVTGGARSGKSAFAEERAREYSQVGYVATGGQRPDDPSWVERIETHQARRPRHWTTHETTDVVAVLTDAPHGTVVLVDCLALWLTSMLDGLNAWEDKGFSERDPRLLEEFAALARAVRATAADVILVTNEVGQGIVPATASGRLFRDCLGRLNVIVAEACDEVVLVVAGRAIALPPALPPASQRRINSMEQRDDDDPPA